MYSRRNLVRWVFCALLTVLWVKNLPWRAAMAGENDFIDFYAGGELSGTPELYHSEAVLRVHQRVLGATSVQIGGYVRLPLYAWACRPLARLPYRTAHALWQALMAGAFVGFILLFRKQAPELPWLAAVSIPFYTAVLNGQDVALVLLLAGLTMRALDKGQDAAAGLWLAACCIKFHFFLFIPVALLVTRRWRAFAWACAGVAAVLGGSFAVQGPHWVQDYIAQLRNPIFTGAAFTLPNLHGAATSLHLPGAGEAALTVLGVMGILVAMARYRAEWKLVFGLALLGGLLLSFHAYVQDMLLLLLVFVLLSGAARWRVWMLALVTPVPCYLLVVNGLVGALTPLALAVLPWFAPRPVKRAAVFADK